MSHIRVDLKVIEVHAPMVARAVSEPVAMTLGGLNLLWHRCWSTKKATITAIGLAGIFGPDNLDTRIAAMVDVGFLEAQADGFVVCGAVKYLRVREGNSKGGNASKSNLIPGGRRPKSSPEGADSEPRVSREGAEREPSTTLGSTSALHRDTETPSTETPSTTAAAGPAVKPTPDSAIGFWVAAQDRREAAGLMREKPPRGLSEWFSVAMLEANGDEQKLLRGFDAFLASPFWRNEAEKPCAWGGWVSQWRDFVTKATAPTVATTSGKPIHTMGNWDTTERRTETFEGF